MKKNLTNFAVIYSVLSASLFISLYGIADSLTGFRPNAPVDYIQPAISFGQYPWTIRSIDTQVVSKHWPNVPDEAIAEQVEMIRELGANYVAVGTPYDKVEQLRSWVEHIHGAGMNVWFRSHWLEWEGEGGRPAAMSPEDYLEATARFIRSNPDLFKPGDAFTVAVEAEQVGVGLGYRFLTWDDYRKFLLDQITVANSAFSDIGLSGEIHTNWLSVNGWVVENQFTSELVEKIGLIVVDHFVGQSNTIGELEDLDAMVDTTIRDLDRFYEKWNVPIMLGEWGYQIFQPVSDERQSEAVRKMFSKLRTREYLVGVNYWVHMGNTASIIGDEYGANLNYRDAAYMIKAFYDPLGDTEAPGLQ